jgi:hypothetical protein
VDIRQEWQLKQFIFMDQVGAGKTLFLVFFDSTALIGENT